MQLTNHTDYALRTLIALGCAAPNKLTANEIADAYGISVHHLFKVVQRLAALGYVETLRGKAGGVKLAVAADQIVIGRVVREMETELGVVACLRGSAEQCVIEPSCRLKSLLKQGSDAFLRTLDAYTLADVLRPTTKLTSLLQLSKRLSA